MAATCWNSTRSSFGNWAMRRWRRAGLDGMDFRHLQAFAALHQVTDDARAFVQFAVAGPLDHGNVQEGVGRALAQLDKTKALGRIEPLDHGPDVAVGDFFSIEIMIIRHHNGHSKTKQGRPFPRPAAIAMLGARRRFSALSAIPEPVPVRNRVTCPVITSPALSPLRGNDHAK